MIVEAERSEDFALRIDCPVLTTARLVMRPPHADDVPDLARLANNRRVAEMTSRMPYPYREADALAFFEAGRKPRPAGAGYALALAGAGAFIGCAGLNATPDGLEPGLELGYWIGQPFWGQGYATEAAHALVDLAFRATEISGLRASCRVINTASRRVLQKCGFQYAGQGMTDSLTSGRVAVERYCLDRRTWVALRSWPQN